MGFPPAITNPLVGNTQQYGGDLMTLIRNYLTNTDIAAGLATLKPVIAKETQFKNDKLTILQTNNNYKYALHIIGTVTHDKTVNVPQLTLDTDELLFVKQAPNAEVENKTFDYTKNSFVNFPSGESNTA